MGEDLDVKWVPATSMLAEMARVSEMMVDSG